MLINTAAGSSNVEYRGVYKNRQITFNATFRITSWLFMKEGQRQSGSSKTVLFKIKANSGYKILIDTNVKFKGSAYKFKSPKIKDNYFENGETSFRGAITSNDIVELEYFVCKTNDDTCERIVKKLKLTLEREPRASHEIIKIKIEEV
jgi:hypothetical protein